MLFTLSYATVENVCVKMAQVLVFVVSFLLFGAVRSSSNFNLRLENSQTEYIANTIVDEDIQQKLYEITKTFLIYVLTPKKPILPIFDDPLNVTDGENNFDSDIIRGTLKNWDSEVLGLSTIVEDLQILPLPPTVKWNFDIETVNFHGMYDADLYLFNEMNFTGSGPFGIELEKGFLDFRIQIKVALITGKISIDTLEVAFGFETLELLAENSFFNGEPIDWADISRQIREIFETYYPTIIDVFIPMAKDIINVLIKDCTLADIGEGDLTCIGYEPPTTSPPEPTNPGVSTTDSPTEPPNPTSSPSEPPNPTETPTESSNPTQGENSSTPSDPTSTTENGSEGFSKLGFISLCAYSIIAKYVIM